MFRRHWNFPFNSLNYFPDVIHNFDYVFWFGDLNFRITQPREQVIEWVSKQKFPLSSSIPFPFYDQLQSSMKKGVYISILLVKELLRNSILLLIYERNLDFTCLVFHSSKTMGIRLSILYSQVILFIFLRIIL